MALNLSTEAMARRSARRPWTTIGIWVLVIVIAIALRGALFEDAITTEFTFTSNPDSKQADELLEDRLRGPKATSEVIIIQSQSMTVDDPAFEAFVQRIFGEIDALGPEVIKERTLTNYYLTQDPFLVSEDRGTTIIPFTMEGEFDDATDNIDGIISIVDQAREAPGFKVLITGQATISQDFEELAKDGLLKGEGVGIPIAVIILVLVFGAVVAALVPVILAVASIFVALGAASLLGQAFGLSFFVENMIFMIGLAVGIDYSLFIVARYREERRSGLEKLEAIGKAGSTATRTVSFSGMAVVFGLIGMLLVPSNVFISIGLAAIFVVIAAVFASMTLLPAILSLLGDRINSSRLALVWLNFLVFGPLLLLVVKLRSFLTRRTETYTSQEFWRLLNWLVDIEILLLSAPFRILKFLIGLLPLPSFPRVNFWDWVSHGVMRQPVVSLILGGGLLVAALIPFFDINTGAAGVSTMPDGIESKEGFLLLDEKFSAGEATPTEIVVDGDINSPAVREGILKLSELLARDESFSRPRPLQVNSALDLALLSVPVAGDATSRATQDAIKRLRNTYIPEAFAGVEATVLVTGETAFNIDFFDIADDAAYVVFPFVLGMSFLLLLVVFRSIVVPLKAVILNLLSVGATYGILVMIFQKGWGNEVFGFQQAETVEAWLPIFLFAVLFGLSMDYHVFLLSRIRERFDQTLDNTESVAFGIRSTGRLITGAALIMVAVFWGFAAGDLVGLQQMGFGLGLAVLLDATIVRMVLVPASMKLLGRWNWYLPKWLEWMPDLRVEAGKEAPAPASAND